MQPFNEKCTNCVLLEVLKNGDTEIGTRCGNGKCPDDCKGPFDKKPAKV